LGSARPPRTVFGTGESGAACRRGRGGIQNPLFARVRIGCSFTTGLTGAAPLGKGAAGGAVVVAAGAGDSRGVKPGGTRGARLV